MMKNKTPINRRTFLRGAGALMALPLLESLPVGGLSTPAMAAPTTTALGEAAGMAPTRFVSFYMPNGLYPQAWDIDASEGRDYAMSELMSPLAPHREQITILKNVDNTFATGHVQMTSAFLSGLPREGKRKADYASVDQMIAQKIGGDSRLRSLVLSTEPPRPGQTKACTVSWSSGASMIVPEINPQAVFDQMFGHRSPEAHERARQRQSVLDTVRQQSRDVDRRVNPADRHKLDEYYESIRSIERRLEHTLNPSDDDGAWRPPMPPGEEDLARPAAGIPENREEHLKLMIDLMVLALWTDTTRVSTCMMGHGFSRKSFDFLPGVRDDHHGMSHHKNQADKIEQYTKVSRWHVEQLAYFLDRMKQIDEGGVSLLDNTLMLFGSGMKDGNGHVKTDLPLVLAGQAGGKMRTGQYRVTERGTPHAKLLQTALQVFDLGEQSPLPIDSEISGLLV